MFTIGKKTTIKSTRKCKNGIGLRKNYKNKWIHKTHKEERMRPNVRNNENQSKARTNKHKHSDSDANPRRRISKMSFFPHLNIILQPDVSMSTILICCIPGCLLASDVKPPFSIFGQKLSALICYHAKIMVQDHVGKDKVTHQWVLRCNNLISFLHVNKCFFFK